jgi:hypothetical protein
MKMKTSLPIVMAFALLAPGVLSTESVSRVESQKARNGTILEIADGFPYTTYEQWLDQGRSQMAFDEARIRRSRQPFRLIFFESGSHGLSEHTEEVNRQTILWFEKHLRR